MQLLAALNLQPDDADQDMAAFGEFHRISDQVGQHLSQPARIADETRGQEHVIVDDQVDAARPRPGLQQHGNLVDCTFQIKGFWV